MQLSENSAILNHLRRCEKIRAAYFEAPMMLSSAIVLQVHASLDFTLARSSLRQMSNLVHTILASHRNTLLSITSNIKIMRPSGGLVPVRRPPKIAHAGIFLTHTWLRSNCIHIRDIEERRSRTFRLNWLLQKCTHSRTWVRKPLLSRAPMTNNTSRRSHYAINIFQPLISQIAIFLCVYWHKERGSICTSCQWVLELSLAIYSANAVLKSIGPNQVKARREPFIAGNCSKAAESLLLYTRGFHNERGCISHRG